MRIVLSLVALILLGLVGSGHVTAFTLSGNKDRIFSITSQRSLRSVSLWSSPQLNEVEALRAAAIKAREEAERLSKELGKTTGETKTASVQKKSSDEIKAIIPSLLAEADISKQAEGWNELKESKSVQAFASANLRTFPVSLKMLEQRTGLNADNMGITAEADRVDLDDFKFATLYVIGGCSVLGVLSLAILPQNVGATVCYLLAVVPIVFLGVGSTAPEVIANAIAILRGGRKDKDGNVVEAVSDQERICRHEAAHFCCGYWCGLPVREYSVQDGVARVEFGAASSSYTPTEVAALTVTALAGLVGEAMKWGSAKGSGRNDLLQLETQVFRRSSEFIGAAAQQELTRWGALTASTLLLQNAAAYNKVVAAFERQAPIEECIAILEE